MYGYIKNDVQDIRLELDELRQFVKTKGLEEEFHSTEAVEVKEEEKEQTPDIDVVNRYPEWDV